MWTGSILKSVPESEYDLSFPRACWQTAVHMMMDIPTPNALRVGQHGIHGKSHLHRSHAPVD